LLESLRFAISVLGDGEFQVETALDGAQGLERVYEVHPDCVIIDVKMPNLNGYQLVHVLRGDPETATIPLVILSALVQERDYQAGMLAGADRYLTKPASPRIIVDAIHQCIDLTENERIRRLQELIEQGAENQEVSAPGERDTAQPETLPPEAGQIWRRNQ
jgi:two-component system alkaline phosphatase synthesis response regulator PhoP